MWNTLEMSNGTKYRVLMPLEDLKNLVDSALRTGGLITVPMGIQEPGSPVTINPSHVVTVSDHYASLA